MPGEKNLSWIDQNGRSFACEILSLAPEHVSQQSFPPIVFFRSCAFDVFVVARTRGSANFITDEVDDGY